MRKLHHLRLTIFLLFTLLVLVTAIVPVVEMPLLPLLAAEEAQLDIGELTLRISNGVAWGAGLKHV